MIDNNENNKYLHFVIFFAILTALVININSFELQPSDEALYAYRAKTIDTSGNFIDQTHEALGGLYSSTSPPLTIWAIYASIKIFGDSEFGVRFFSMICSLISAMLIYYIAAFFIEKKWAISAPVVLSSALIWNNFSRQAMTEIPLNMFFLLCFFLICKIYLNNNFRHNIFLALLFSLSLAAALLTKITISLFPIIFIIIFLFSNELKEKKLLLTVATLLSLLIAAPWYIYMINQYGSEFYNALFLPHINTVVEGNSRSSGIFYYINLLIIGMPIISYFILQPKIIKYKLNAVSTRNYGDNFFKINIYSWFLAFFLAFTFSKTKNPHYCTYLIPPTVLILAYLFSNLKNITLNKAEIFALIFSLFGLIFWSLFYNFRMSLKSINPENLSFELTLFLSIMIISGVIILLLSENQTLKLSGILNSQKFIITVAIVFLLRIIINNAFIDPKIRFNAQETIRTMKNFKANSFVYLYYHIIEGDTLNPQFKWYLQKENYHPHIYKIDAGKYDNHSISYEELQKYDDEYLIYYAYEGLTSANPTVLELLKTRLLINNYANYLIFSKSVINR